MLLDRLEISEVTFSKLNNETRLDAEYFKNESLSLSATLKKHELLTIGEFAYVTDGIHTAIDYCEKSRVNLISATSPKENIFDLTRQVFISEDAHSKNPRTALKKGDVIVSTVGTIGNCAVVDDSVLPANSDRHVGIIRIEKDFLPYFLSTFLITKYGKFQTLRKHWKCSAKSISLQNKRVVSSVFNYYFSNKNRNSGKKCPFKTRAIKINLRPS